MAGTSARSWGIGRAASKQQLSQFEAVVAPAAQALDASGGPYLLGSQPTLVSSPMCSQL